jgi:hypothetical protein
MTEQSFKFFSLLLIYLACGAYRAQSPRWWIVGLAGTLIFLALLRPAAILMAFVIYGALLVNRPQTWKLLAGAAASLAAAVFVYSFAVCLLLPPAGLYKPNETSRLQNLAFYDLYMVDDASALDPGKGERRRELREVMDAFARDLPNSWLPRLPARYFAPYAQNPKAWVEQIFREPNRYKYMMLKDAVKIYRDMGPDPALRAKARRIISRVIWEVYLYEPWRLLSMIVRYGASVPGGGSQQIMFNNIFSWHQLAKFSPDNGPASREFIETVRNYYVDNPTELAKLVIPPDNKNFATDVDGFIRERLLGVPNANLFYRIWLILEDQKDPLRARQLYTGADREGLENAPGGQWQAYQTLAKIGAAQLSWFFFGVYSLPHFEFFHSYVQCHQAYERELLSGMRLFDWIPIEPDKLPLGYRSWFDYVFQALWVVFHLGCTYFIILAGPFALFTRYRWPILLSATIILVHAVPTTFVVYAQHRYVDQTLPVAILLSGFVLAAIVEKIWRRKAAGP